MAGLSYATMILEAFCRATGAGMGQVDVAVGSELECFVAEQASRPKAWLWPTPSDRGTHDRDWR